jgi:hypothetical protein
LSGFLEDFWPNFWLHFCEDFGWMKMSARASLHSFSSRRHFERGIRHKNDSKTAEAAEHRRQQTEKERPRVLAQSAVNDRMPSDFILFLIFSLFQFSFFPIIYHLPISLSLYRLSSESSKSSHLFDLNFLIFFRYFSQLGICALSQLRRGGERDSF